MKPHIEELCKDLFKKWLSLDSSCFSIVTVSGGITNQWSYSYWGYDIANHFNEYAGYECDYILYPDKNAQYHFFRNYLQPDAPQEVPDKDLDDLYVETSTFRLASHAYGAVWALIQMKMSPINFNYLGYFFLRYREYKKHKETCFSLARKCLSGSSIH